MTAIAFENASKETSGNVAELISMNAQTTMAVNRQCLLQIIECCRVLTRQNIAFKRTNTSVVTYKTKYVQ